MTLTDVLLVAVIALLVFLAVRSIARRKTRGGCCGSCIGCGQANHCPIRAK